MPKELPSVTLLAGQTIVIVGPPPMPYSDRKTRTRTRVTAPGTYVEPPPVEPPPTGPPPTRTFGPGTYATLPTLAAGDVWQFDPGAIVTAHLDIRVKATIRGGIWRQPIQTSIGYGDTVGIYAPDVTLDGVTFDGGAIGVACHNAARAKLLNIRHTNRSNCSIYLWGGGNDDALIEGFSLTPAVLPGASIIGASGGINQRVIVRNGTADAGPGGHFGIEMLDCPGIVIDRVTLGGGSCLVSLPHSHNARVTRSTFDMRAMVKTPETWKADGWGIELADARDCVVGGTQGMGNTFTGSSGDQHAVSCNTNADRATVSWNTATDIAALVDGGGTGLVVLDNCLTRVPTVVAYPQDAPGYVAARNGPC